MTELLTQDDFRRLAGYAITATTAKHIQVAMSDESGGTTRFANNQVSQNVNARRQSLSITVANGQRHGTATTGELSLSAIRGAVAAAEDIARVAPDDPEYLPPLEAQQYPLLANWRPETAACTPDRRISAARTAIELCKAASMTAAGIVEAYQAARGVATNAGLFAYEKGTRSELTLTATASDSSGWAGNASRSIDDLDAAALARTAIQKARDSASPIERPAGRYTVVLEPAAVAGLIGPLFESFDAKAYFAGTSALAGRLHDRIIDPRLSVQNRPDHPGLMGASFDGGGLPADFQTWIDRGSLARLRFDRFTAQEKETQPSFGMDAPLVEGDPSSAVDTIDDLVADTKRGFLVTTFWYIRYVNPTDLTLTGMTRDGVFPIEDGRIAGGALNFRWHDSPLRALNAISGYTRPYDAITWERGKMMLPALRIDDFNFSSVTKF